MKVYNYNSEGYLIGVSELDNSDKCQITGEWLIPAQATEKEPLVPKDGFEIKFLENEWQYIKLLTDGEKKVLGDLPLEVGEKIIDGTLVNIESPSELHSWNGKEWYLDEEKVRISKLPSQDEVFKMQIQLELLNALTELGVI